MEELELLLVRLLEEQANRPYVERSPAYQSTVLELPDQAILFG